MFGNQQRTKVVVEMGVKWTTTKKKKKREVEANQVLSLLSTMEERVEVNATRNNSIPTQKKKEEKKKEEEQEKEEGFESSLKR